MTKRLPTSVIHNRWHDAQRVDRGDMNTEQQRNIRIDAAIINNHFGSGVLPSSITQNVIFDSDDLTSTQASLVSSGDFDGTGVQPHNQPSDTNLGNQLEVELTNTTAFGRLSTKVLIIGLNFQNVPQYDRFTFYRAEKQVTRKHYKHILGIFFNDFKGNNNCSRTLGGRVVIREAASLQLSRDALSVAQDTEPNLFFRDFKVANSADTLSQTLQSGIGAEYSIDSLNINTTVKQNRIINQNDVTSKIGQKFKATTNNIQKITLLLGAGRDNSVAIENRFDWSGDLVISVWELQTTVSCPTNIVPELDIEFNPKSEPLAQLSFSQSELLDLGYVLTDVLQPVDFVFSDTQLGSTTNPVIVPGRHYAITINRQGSAGIGQIVTGVGNNRTEDARLTLFSGTWVDVTEEDLWFQVWSDSAKVADGQAYDAGNGIQIDKTSINELGAEIDFVLKDLAFSDSGENILNTAIIQAISSESVEEQDERTGNPINSRQKFETGFSFLTSSALEELEETTEPLVIGCTQDINPKQNSTITKIQDLPGLASGDTFTVIAPDADLLSNNLVGSKLIPNQGNSANTYRIFKVLSCVDGYGDVNGDGIIDADDIARASELIGEGLVLNSTQQKIVDGYISTLELLRADVDGDGYVSGSDVTLITDYVNREINSFPVGSTFTHIEIIVQQSVGRFDGYFDCDGYIRLDGYQGQNIVSSDSLDPAELLYDGYITDVNIELVDSAFTTVPFSNVTYQILPQPFWQDYLLAFSSEAKQVPASFTFDEGITPADCAPSNILFSCTDRADVDTECAPGRNDIMFPDNIILRRGQILSPSGEHHKIDFEVAQVIIQLPETPLSESVINIFDKFVADTGEGFTSAGFNAMRFADCTTVQSDALAKNQVRFGVAIQSTSFNLDGYDDDGYGIVVNDGIHAFMDNTNGILHLTVSDLETDEIFQTQITKIQITVYLKKGGFNNEVLVIEPSQILGLFST